MTVFFTGASDAGGPLFLVGGQNMFAPPPPPTHTHILTRPVINHKVMINKVNKKSCPHMKACVIITESM